jgi:hypothetical protein
MSFPVIPRASRIIAKKTNPAAATAIHLLCWRRKAVASDILSTGFSVVD